ncbi:MAG: hypothetical protein JW726_11730 [Anaerolineales bacterium]|nr:hypothetical protein [Anaerolineales bacterium]
MRPEPLQAVWPGHCDRATLTRAIAVILLVIGLALTGVFYAHAQSNEALTILIASPSEGATFYAAPDRFRLAMPITGQVVSYTEHLDPTTVEVHLELVSRDGSQFEMDVPVNEEGRFHVWASLLSPDLPWPSDDFHVREMCGECHRKYVDLSMPENISHLVITARAADGRTGQAIRNIRFDLSYRLPLEVTVEGLPENAQDIQITATTLLYDWRRRSVIDEVLDGKTTLMVESLRYVDLTYTVSMVPAVIDGILYQAEPREVSVPAATEGSISLTLTAVSHKGEITGRVLESGTGTGLAASLLLVETASGNSRVTRAAADGAFVFADLPIVEYALLAKTPGYVQLPARLNLAEEPVANVETFLIPAGSMTLQGTALHDSMPLPFVEAAIDGLPVAYGNPLSGAFSFPAVPIVDDSNAIAVEISAAGYYSARITATDGDLGEIKLALRTDTRVVEHGDTRLYIPAATRLREIEDAYILERGVFWVTSPIDSPPAPFHISVGVYDLVGEGASFAVERLTGAPARVYVRSGQVQAMKDGLDTPLTITAGETMALDADTTSPVALANGAGALLRSLAGAVTRFELPPSPEEQRNAIIKQVVVTIARGFMVGAYAIAYVLMPAAIVIGIVLTLFPYFRKTFGR